MKQSFLVLSALIAVGFSSSAFADTKVQTFNNVGAYAKFVGANPKVKIIAVTSLVSTTDKCPTANYSCPDVHTDSILVTYEQ